MKLDLGGLGAAADFTDALGLTIAGDLNSDWFGSPETYLGDILRNDTQRKALVNAIDGIFPGEASTDRDGRQWVPVVSQGAVTVCLTLLASDAGAVVGLGARVRSTGPEAASVDAHVPVLWVPATGNVAPALGGAQGAIQIEARVAILGSDLLRGVGLRATVPTDGTLPTFVVELVDLALGGAPQTVRLGEGGAARLPEDALRLLSGLLRAQAGTATGIAADLLALVGLGGDTALPAFPVAAMLADGPVALRGWLREVFVAPDARNAWLGHVQRLLQDAGMSVELSGGRLSWPLASEATAYARVDVAPGSGEDVTVSLGGGVRWVRAGTPAADLELDLVATRFTLGASPGVIGVPSLSAMARLGPTSGSFLVPTVTAGPLSVSVRAVRIGVALREDRTLAFVLEAEDATIDGHP